MTRVPLTAVQLIKSPRFIINFHKVKSRVLMKGTYLNHT